MDFSAKASEKQPRRKANTEVNDLADAVSLFKTVMSIGIL